MHLMQPLWRYSIYFFFSDSEIVIPVIVDSHGSFVSHDLTHYIRHTRSTLSSSISTHVNISGFGQTFQIDLIEERKLLAPGFRVYHRHNNNNNSHSESFVRSQEKPWDETRCHFSGKVRSHRHGTAALSVCDGMVGNKVVIPSTLFSKQVLHNRWIKHDPHYILDY